MSKSKQLECLDVNHSIYQFFTFRPQIEYKTVTKNNFEKALDIPGHKRRNANNFYIINKIR